MNKSQPIDSIQNQVLSWSDYGETLGGGGGGGGVQISGGKNSSTLGSLRRPSTDQRD